LAVAERYNQPFGIYAYDLLRNFDLPDVAGIVGPRSVLLLDPATPLGEPAGPAVEDLYKDMPHVRVQTTVDRDAVQVLAAWIRGHESGLKPSRNASIRSSARIDR
jgi:hypothetical protein